MLRFVGLLLGILFDPEDEGSMFLRKVHGHLPNHTGLLVFVEM
jgi:hypothetical protein